MKHSDYNIKMIRLQGFAGLLRSAELFLCFANLHLRYNDISLAEDDIELADFFIGCVLFQFEGNCGGYIP